MSTLRNKRCLPCNRKAPPATEEQIAEWLPEVPDWELIDRDEVPKLRREFTFRNFKQALEFTDAIGALAEKERHHPAILTEWGTVTVTLWTHAIKALHQNDFILAAKIDELPMPGRPGMPHHGRPGMPHYGRPGMPDMMLDRPRPKPAQPAERPAVIKPRLGLARLGVAGKVWQEIIEDDEGNPVG
jgi:4a-hydroxytetrahydrobiopterin dehydratase